MEDIKRSSGNRDGFKVMILGEAGVGKTSLIRRFKQGHFSPDTTTTVGVDRILIKVKLDSEVINFQVLDTAGCFGFHSLIKSYVNNVDAVIFVYDLTNKETFACLPLWKSLMKQTKNKNLVQVLVGNKRDLAQHREVQFKNAKHYAEFEGMVAMEVSVKEEDSVELVFQSIARELLLKSELTKMNHTNVKTNINGVPPRPRSAELIEKERVPFSHLVRTFRFLFNGRKTVTCSKSESSLDISSTPQIGEDVRTIKNDYLRWI